MGKSRNGVDRRAVPRWVDAVVIAAAALAMLLWTWGKWADPFVDFGRELYVPWQLSEGRVLQREIAYLNGPLSPYWNALLFRLFGVSMRTITLANLVGIALLSALIHRLLRAFHGRIGATAGTTLFILLFAFGTIRTTGNYNNVAPYSHEMTHGMLLSFAAILLLHRAAHGLRFRGFFAAGLCLGSVGLTKPEVFVALLAGVAAGVAICARSAAGGIRWRMIFGIVAGSVVPPTIAWILLSTAMSAGEAARAVAGAWPALLTGAADRTEFYRSWAGLLDIGPHLRAMLFWSVGWAGGLALLAAASFVPVGGWRTWVRGAVAFGLFGLLCAASSRVVDWRGFAHPLPIAVAAYLAALILRRSPRSAEAERRFALRAASLVFAGVLLLKMGLFPRIYYYGWSLGMPSAVLLAAGLVDGAPQWIRGRGGSRAIALGGAFGILAAVSAIHLVEVARPLASMNHRVGTGGDTFYADRRGEILGRVLQSVEEHVPSGGTVAVVPEGVMVNFLSRRPNPTRYFSFVPLEAALYGEEAFLAAFAADTPDYLLFVHRPTLEYGPDWAYFSGNYAVRFGQWLHDRYRRVDRIEAEGWSNEPFGWAMLMRLDARGREESR